MDDERVKPWRWPGQWFRDEKFWRDVGSRTLSGLLVALIIYVFAVLGGYVRKPAALPVLFMAIGLSLIYLWWRYLSRKWKRMYAGPNPTWAQEQGKFDRKEAAWVGFIACYWIGGLALFAAFSKHK